MKTIIEFQWAHMTVPKTQRYDNYLNCGENDAQVQSRHTHALHCLRELLVRRYEDIVQNKELLNRAVVIFYLDKTHSYVWSIYPQHITGMTKCSQDIFSLLLNNYFVLKEECSGRYNTPLLSFNLPLLL